ncbi:MAG: TRAP transporter small permease [Tindallia sp. MSAO_Bac2]|nr:MAG: TRAP transporter small permease [Tindallia sp. MSAO_Bac2]
MKTDKRLTKDKRPSRSKEIGRGIKMKIAKYLNENLERILVIILLGAMSIIIGSQVFMRYIMRASLSWSEEIARYMFVWLTYIGISYGVKTNRHIKVDAAMFAFPIKTRKYVKIFGNLIFLIFAGIIVWNSVNVSARILSLGQKSPAIGIPMGFIYMAPLFGFILVGIRLIQSIYNDILILKGGGSE